MLSCCLGNILSLQNVLSMCLVSNILWFYKDAALTLMIRWTEGDFTCCFMAFTTSYCTVLLPLSMIIITAIFWSIKFIQFFISEYFGRLVDSTSHLHHCYSSYYVMVCCSMSQIWGFSHHQISGETYTS